jgi:hypothetical protein
VISMGFFGWIIHICAAFDAWASNTPDERVYEPPTPKTKPHSTITWDSSSEVFIYQDNTPEKDVTWH